MGTRLRPAASFMSDQARLVPLLAAASLARCCEHVMRTSCSASMPINATMPSIEGLLANSNACGISEVGWLAA